MWIGISSGASRNHTAASGHSTQEAGRRATACYTRVAKSQEISKSVHFIQLKASSTLFSKSRTSNSIQSNHSPEEAGAKNQRPVAEESQNLNQHQNLQILKDGCPIILAV